MKTLLLILILCFATILHAAVVNSPNGRISVNIEIKEKLEPYPVGARLYYSIEKDGQPILLDSPFRVDFKNMPPFATNLQLVDE